MTHAPGSGPVFDKAAAVAPWPRAILSQALSVTTAMSLQVFFFFDFGGSDLRGSAAQPSQAQAQKSHQQGHDRGQKIKQQTKAIDLAMPFSNLLVVRGITWNKTHQQWLVRGPRVSDKQPTGNPFHPTKAKMLWAL